MIKETWYDEDNRHDDDDNGDTDNKYYLPSAIDSWILSSPVEPQRGVPCSPPCPLGPDRRPALKHRGRKEFTCWEEFSFRIFIIFVVV